MFPHLICRKEKRPQAARQLAALPACTFQHRKGYRKCITFNKTTCLEKARTKNHKNLNVPFKTTKQTCKRMRLFAKPQDLGS